MVNRNSRPWLDRIMRRAKSDSALALEERAGRGPVRLTGRARVLAAGAMGDADNGFEVLEQRVLLAGDHPSLNPNLFPNHPATVIDMFVNGRAALDGIIQAPGTTGPGGTVPAGGDDDLFRFQAPAGANFVSILADTINYPGGSSLNSRVVVYDHNGQQISVGTHNGVLSTTRPGVATDGWVGFIANPGDHYFIQVTGENGTLGGYVLRVNALTTTLTTTTTPNATQTVGEAFIPNVPDTQNLPGAGPNRQLIEFPQDERIYRVTAPDTIEYDSLATASARADRTNPPLANGSLDTHLEVYDAQGNEIASDIEAGFLNDAFVTWRARPGETYYIRVRSDDLRNPAQFPSIGAFQLRVDISAKDIPIDPVTRRGRLTENLDGDPSANRLFNAADTGLFKFTAQGTGTGIITVRSLPPPAHDVAVRLFDFDGVFLAYNNDFAGTHAQIEYPVVGGETYFLVVDGFPDAPSGFFDVWIEAHHTFNTTTDDHVNRPSPTLNPQQVRTQFNLATALRWNDPHFLYEAPEAGRGDLGPRHPYLDRGYVQTSVATGRINRPGDSDLFQFTPPVDMLSNHGGNNDDVGAALFAGGRFMVSDPDSLWPRPAGAVGTWDADDWWYNSRVGEAPDGFEYGFFPNTLGQAEVYAMHEFDPDGAGTAFGPALFVGGDFLIRVPGAEPGDPPVEIRNLAMWTYIPFLGRYEWLGVGDPDGAVRAMTVYTPPVQGGTSTPQLILGGDFENILGLPMDRLAFIQDGFIGELGDGLGFIAPASVRALAVFDPPDPGSGRPADNDANPPLLEVLDPRDPPNTLFIGGTVSMGGVPTAFFMAWDGDQLVDDFYGQSPNGVLDAPVFVGSSINAMRVFNSQDPDRPGPTLIIAGNFSGVFDALGNFINSPNIVSFGRAADNELIPPDPFTDPDVPNYAPRLMFDSMGGTNGPVHALAVWDQPDVFPTPTEPVLVVGGEFTTAGGAPVLNLATWTGLAWANLGGGVDGPVYSLTVSRTAGGQLDDQEPGIALVGDDPQEALYVGGSFNFANPGPFAVPAQNIVQRSWVITPFGPAPTWRALNTGVDGPVLALTMFDDQNPAVDNSGTLWDRNDRPGSRMNVVLNPTADSAAPFLDVAFRVWDSNFNLVYPNNTTGPYNFNVAQGEGLPPLAANGQIVLPPAVNPAGMRDPSNPHTGGPATVDAIRGIPLWGGETYYIEVISRNGTTGRYELTVTIDALPPDLNGDGSPNSPTVASWTEVPNAGNWQNAAGIGGPLATGNNTNFMPGEIFAYNERNNRPYPSRTQTFHRNELAAIEHIQDTDLYTFIAEEAGWVEVRINTFQIRRDPSNPLETDGDAFAEITVDLESGEQDINEIFKVYNSNLDGRLVIFNNDFEAVTYSDSNPGVPGEFASQPVFATGNRNFTQRDPRVVFRVERGQRYFIQVESAQKAVFEENPDLVDWRHAIGSYELLLNAMPFFNFDDDHSPTGSVPGAFWPTPIPVGQRSPDPLIPAESANGRGSVTGEIRNTFQNPNDNDAFFFYAHASGLVTATITVTNPSSGLRANITTFNQFFQAAAAPATTAPGGSTSVSWVAQKGQLYYVIIAGAGGSQGRYRVDINSPQFVDDHSNYNQWTKPDAPYNQWSSPTELPLQRYFGVASGSGVIEAPNDSDMFYFDAEATEVAHVRVESLSATLRARLLVYEVGKDGADNDTFLLINLTGDGSAPGLNAQAEFPVTAGQRYYFVVSGVDRNVDFGAYNIVVTVAASDDHPDLPSPWGSGPLATQLDLLYNPTLGLGTASATGVLERPEDTDLFAFAPPIRGNALITLTSTDPALPVRVQLYNSAGVLMLEAASSGGTAVINGIDVLQGGQQYFISVAPGDGLIPGDYPVAYSLALQTSPVDDHANAGNFAGATQILLSATTGVGSQTGVLVPVGDTDLFYFETRFIGPVVIEVTTPASNLDPQMRVFNSSHQQIAFSAGTTELVIISVNSTAVGQRFYVLIEADANAANGARVGDYIVRVSNTASPGGGPGGPSDDHANQGDFDDATEIEIASRTGNGQNSGIIDFQGDTDLFFFEALAAGPVRVHITTPQGSPLNAAVRVYNAAQAQIRFNSVGMPGVSAATSFEAEAGEVYYILVEQVGTALGAYTVRIDSAPPVYFLYYPEGFSGSTINEFVPVVNPNTFDVTYTVIARYEVGVRDQVLFQGVIPANSRGGITISTSAGENPWGIRVGEPYALEIQSSGQLGATLSHYDFDITTGESFTEQTSTLWTFSEARKNSAAFRDFLVYYNPGEVDGTVTVTLTYNDGTVTTFTRAIEALRRGGVNFNDDLAIDREGVFSIKVESTVPIVAALSSYDIQNGRGFGLLGNPDGGATRGVLPAVSTGSGVESSVSIYNAGAASATVTLRGTYQRADLPQFVRTITVPAGGRFSATMASLGLIDSQVAGIRYESTTPVTVTAIQYRNGDGDATTAPTRAVTSALIGDAFVNPAVAGITYIEELALYNPAAIDVNITITFLFSDGSVGQYVDPSTGSSSINIGADRFALIRIDQQPAILSRPDLAFFSIRLDAATPFIAAFNHYDLFLNGGWGALAAPVGLTVPLSRI